MNENHFIKLLLSIVLCLMAISWRSPVSNEKNDLIVEKSSYYDYAEHRIIKLNGPVKELKIEYFIAEDKFGKIITDGRRSNNFSLLYQFAPNKTMTNLKSCVYRLDGSLDQEMIEKYDEEGNRIERYFIIDGSIESKEVTKYNKDRKITEQYYYGSGEKLDSLETYLFDINGNMIEGCYFKGNGILNKKIISKYDNEGKFLQSCYYKSDGSIEKKFKNVIKGDVIESYTIDSEGTIIQKRTDKYNENGKIIETRAYHSNGKMFLNMKYTYNENLIITENISCKPDGRLISKKVQKMDNNGNIYESSHFNYDENFTDKWIFSYDKNGNNTEIKNYSDDGNLKSHNLLVYKGKTIIKETFIFYHENGSLDSKSITTFYESDYKDEDKYYSYAPDGSIEDRMIAKYDENGNIISIEASIDGVTTFDTYEFEKDPYDNWIKRTKYCNTIPVEITERVIVYY